MALRLSRKEAVALAARRSPKQEKELAARMGGQRTPQSGAGMIKGDVKCRGVARIEAKATQKASFSITQAMLKKIEDQAMAAGEVPAIVVEFLNAAGKPKGSVAVIPVWALEMLLKS